MLCFRSHGFVAEAPRFRPMCWLKFGSISQDGNHLSCKRPILLCIVHMPEAMSHQRFLTILSVLWASSAAFKLLDVGAPRAGTQTMYDAMRILGFNPLHTGVSREIRPPLCDYLFGNGRLEDALATLAAFDGAMDEPVMLVYEEVMAAFPETKFVLTIRDAESWFSNYLHVGQMMYSALTFPDGSQTPIVLTTSALACDHGAAIFEIPRPKRKRPACKTMLVTMRGCKK